jgi:putative ABC transport system substrate-binding protein
MEQNNAGEMMRKRFFGLTLSSLPFALCSVGALLIGICSSSEAQQPSKKTARIGYLTLGSGLAEPEVALKQQLGDLGWIEGQNLTIEYRRAANDTSRLPNLAKELVDSKVDVIVASATPAIQAAKGATATIPIVMAAAADPVGMGFVASLARPGGNITGLSLQSPELAGKRLELLKEIVPKLTRVAFLAHGGDPAHKLFIEEAHDVAPRIGIQIQPVVIKSPGEFEIAFSVMIRERAGALVVQPLLTGSALGQGLKVANLAAKHRLPAVSDSIRFPESGGLISYGANRLDLWQRAATFVDKILRGTKPADLPVEQPTKFDLVINLKTANQIGLTIPPDVLARAVRVIR